MRQAISFLSLLVLGCACIQIQNKNFCSVAGTLSGGAFCVESLTGVQSDLTFEETVKFLEASDARGAAVFMSLDDFTKFKTELEQACRELGDRCKKEVKEAMERVDVIHALKGQK